MDSVIDILFPVASLLNPKSDVIVKFFPNPLGLYSKFDYLHVPRFLFCLLHWKHHHVAFGIAVRNLRAQQSPLRDLESLISPNRPLIEE